MFKGSAKPQQQQKKNILGNENFRFLDNLVVIDDFGMSTVNHFIFAKSEMFYFTMN